MRWGSASVVAASGAIAGMTVATRVGALSASDVVASPRAVAAGRVWLLVSSALVADRPALPSLLGFLVVGLVTVELAGVRVLWLSAACGHIGSALVVYAVVGLADVAAPSTVGPTLTIADYGTSAMIAAWIGVIAYRWATTRRGPLGTAGAIALCATSGLVGWLLKGALTVLDTEHAVALLVGVAVAGWGASLKLPQVGQAMDVSRRLRSGLAAAVAIPAGPLRRRSGLSAARPSTRG